MPVAKLSKRKTTSKPKVKTIDVSQIASKNGWVIVKGSVAPVSAKPKGRGRPKSPTSLFRAVAEKIPYEFLGEVKNAMGKDKLPSTGVYIAHDSMGYPRYVGRGSIITRLRQRKAAQKLELCYFSFYIVANKSHEREIETIMIRAAGPILDFNSRKVRTDIQAGDIKDFDPGTRYFQRQYKKGKKPSL